MILTFDVTGQPSEITAVKINGQMFYPEKKQEEKFDWATVQAGMAFKDRRGKSWWFVCKRFSTANFSYLFAPKTDWDTSDLMILAYRYLERDRINDFSIMEIVNK